MSLTISQPLSLFVLAKDESMEGRCRGREWVWDEGRVREGVGVIN